MFADHHARTAGALGMFGAGLFFVALLIEYRYGLFPPGSGALYVANQLMFLAAMVCILIMLWGMRMARAGGNGRFGRVTLTILPLGWAALTLGGIIGLLTGNSDNLLIPLGALTTLMFGLPAGIAVAAAKVWTGWPRFALLVEGVYFALVMMILPPVLTGSNEPTLLTESLWMATWFLSGLALWRVARTEMAASADLSAF